MGDIFFLPTFVEKNMKRQILICYQVQQSPHYFMDDPTSYIKSLVDHKRI